MALASWAKPNEVIDLELSDEHLITRTFQKDDAASVAVYSSCEQYRYLLTRVWVPDGKRLLFVMLNPSTATEFQNDPSVERCERRARHLGYGAFRVCNIFALRSTDPKALYRSQFPVGDANDMAISTSCKWADKIVCAWGNHGNLLDRGKEVERIVRYRRKEVFHLGLTGKNCPRHPLYVPYSQEPIVWNDCISND